VAACARHMHPGCFLLILIGLIDDTHPSPDPGPARGCTEHATADLHETCHGGRASHISSRAVQLQREAVRSKAAMKL